ncbi:Cue3p [Saccharomyces eubayanus]|uniref:Cue3p n=1 Tax=Saccharomyces eubayanus TaxID=1080349 RepID=UPI0006C0849A|nr:CUE3-like protein [Saccharomyces eubayanus]KOG99411.1 CUE3-like protein [Saccharomyces eubayanus]
MLSRYNRVIDIEGGNAEISLPIVNFPPFRLRAQLIEKDPVVWLHLLETYVTYLEYLMQGTNIELLNDSTLDHFRLFLRSYLHEIADEEGKLLSLGINHDVSEQLHLLKGWIFSLVKKCGLLHLQIFGDSLWDMVKIYVKRNPDSIRGLIDGSLKPQINTQRVQLDKTYQLQQHLKQLIESGKFKKLDLKCVEDLLTAKSIQPNKFAENFFTASWIEILEALWSKGQGRAHEISKKLIIINIFSVSANHLLKITQELGISNLETLALYPLLGTILINENIHKRLPDLKSKLLFLNFGSLSMNIGTSTEHSSSTSNEINEDHVLSLMELFPQFSKYQLSQTLLAYDDNIELVTNKIFEDPTIIEAFPRESGEEETRPISSGNNTAFTDELSLSNRVPSSKNKDLDKKIISGHVPDELRNKTLTRALKLLYEGDEDERDDTYDEADVSRSDLSKRINVQEDEGKSQKQDDTSEEKQPSQYDAVEAYLWELLKQDQTLFERSKRGSKVRKSMKEHTSWSDEQIEGWSRMLERSPQRARLLEEKFMFKGNFKSGKTSYVHNRDDNTKDSTKEQTKKKAPKVIKKDEPQSVEKTKRQHAKNEKKKGARANHNRKGGHDKKLARAGGNGV